MRKIDIQLHRLLLAGLLWLATGALYAQPHGWPCDYGYRPGNTWFYRSTSFQGKIYSETVVRDSVGADGDYWVYFVSPSFNADDWFRISNECVFDEFGNPTWSEFQRMFIARADSGEWWMVDTVSTATPLYAQVNAIYHPVVFGKQVTSKEIVYYPDQSGKNWYFSAEYAEGIGIIHKWRHPSGYDEIVGAIIDGIAYGDVSGVAESPADAASHFGVRPLPASSHASLDIIAYGKHRAMLEIHDMLGRLMLRRQLDDFHDGLNTIPLDISSLSSSSYMIAVDIDGSIYTTPLVIAR